MIAYLDTSSLVKLYFEEEGSESIQAMVEEADSLSTSWLSYVEARSAFSRKYREGGMTLAQYESVLSTFEDEWAKYSATEVSSQIMRQAGGLTEKHGLRALDAIHLASAMAIRDDRSRQPISVFFSSSDARLRAAGRAERLQVPPVL